MTDPRRLVTADRPADIAEADWQNILRGSAFAKALGIVYGDPTGEQADRWLDEAGEIEQQLAREGYVVVPAEVPMERDQQERFKWAANEAATAAQAENERLAEALRGVRAMLRYGSYRTASSPEKVAAIIDAALARHTSSQPEVPKP